MYSREKNMNETVYSAGNLPMHGWRVLTLLAVCVAVLATATDPYAALGLKRGAQIKDIKKAYKTLVKEW